MPHVPVYAIEFNTIGCVSSCLGKVSLVFKVNIHRCNAYILFTLSCFLNLSIGEDVSAGGITVSVSEIDGVIQRDGTGLYNPIFDYLTELEIETKVVYSPGNRARRNFLEGTLDCLFPSSKRLLEETSLTIKDVVISEPVAIGRGLVVFHNVENPAKLDKSLRLGVVDITELYGFESVGTITVRGYSELISLVEAGRLEAGYFMYPDVYGIAGLADRLKPRLSSAIKIWEEGDSIVCRQKHSVIVNQISKEIRLLKQSKQLVGGVLKLAR